MTMTSLAARLGPPDVGARGEAAVEDAKRRVSETGRELRIYPSDPIDTRGRVDGWEVLRVAVTEPGYEWPEWGRAPVGEGECAYLKAIWIRPETISERAPNPILWQFSYGGWRGDTSTAEKLYESVRRYVGFWEPESPTEADRRKILKQVEERYQRPYQRWCRQVSQPWVDYANVASNRQRLGLATAMYQAAAGYLAAVEGLTLRCSTLQSDQAKATWERIAHLWGLEPFCWDEEFDRWVYNFDLR